MCFLHKCLQILTDLYRIANWWEMGNNLLLQPTHQKKAFCPLFVIKALDWKLGLYAFVKIDVKSKSKSNTVFQGLEIILKKLFNKKVKKTFQTKLFFHCMGCMLRKFHAIWTTQWVFRAFLRTRQNFEKWKNRPGVCRPHFCGLLLLSLHRQNVINLSTSLYKFGPYFTYVTVELL